MAGGETEVWVGRPGDLVEPGAPHLLYATKMGGAPVYPPGVAAPDARLTTCGACGGELSLVLQAHAPLSAKQTGGAAARERFIYMFGCAAAGCGAAPESWRFLRCQPPGAGDAGAAAAVKEPAPAAAAAAALDAGGAGDSFAFADAAAGWGLGGEDEGQGQGGAPLDDGFADMQAALDALARSGGAAADPTRANPPKGSGGAAAAAAAAPAAGWSPPAGGAPRLAEFYLVAALEADAAAAAGAPPRRGGVDDARLAALVEAYRREEAEAEGAAQQQAQGAGGGGEAWGGEAYEPDAVLVPPEAKRRGADAAFLRFAKRLGAAPDQCARWAYGAPPLWPAAEPPAAPPCAACGAPRVPELVVVSPALAALGEAAAWAAEGGGGGAAAACAPPPDGWEWAAVAGFACGRACAPPGGWAAEAACVAGE